MCYDATDTVSEVEKIFVLLYGFICLHNLERWSEERKTQSRLYAFTPHLLTTDYYPFSALEKFLMISVEERNPDDDSPAPMCYS